MNKDIFTIVTIVMCALLVMTILAQVGVSQKLQDTLRINAQLIHLLKQVAADQRRMADGQDVTVDVLDLLAEITGAKPESR